MDKNQNGTITLADTEIDLYTLIHDIVVNWWVVLLGAIAAALLSVVIVSVRYVPDYTTQTTFVVVAKSQTNSYSNLSSTNTMATAFQKVLESTVLQKAVCEDLGKKKLNADIQAQVAEGTNLMTLTVTAKTPKDSIDIINSIMDNYSSVSLYTVGNAVMEVLQNPMVPYAPDHPLDTKTARNRGFIGGALVVIFLLGLLSVMKNTVKQEREIERKLDARNLGEISFEWKYKTIRDLIRHKKKAALVDDPVAGFRFVESYKKLAAKVEYQMGKEDRKVLVVTSVAENEGKSTVAANLAITFAGQGKRVILLDGDIRRPSQFLIFGMNPKEENEIGEFLQGKGAFKDVVQQTNRQYLHLIGGKRCYNDSTEILSIEGRLERILSVCRKVTDFVIIDTPPAGLIGDAHIFANEADAVMIVARQNYMLAEDINEIMDEFRDNGAKILGVVLNGVQKFESLSESPVGHYYGRYGNYGKYGRYGYGRQSSKEKGK